jgi:UDP:flavonoid glycosyltransferase YjiC (YdhE family)
MSTDLRVDFVAPPFAGHLFPLLELASSLGREGLRSTRVLSTSDVADTIRLCGLEPVDLLPGRADEVWAIANTSERTGANPLRLYRQFRANMHLMADVATRLERAWAADRPDLVIADFTVPVAGLVARRLGIRWWTSLPSPCVLESRTGPPAYLGGLAPGAGAVGKVRDAIGRALIRTFKRGVARLFRRELRAIGFDGVYRADGSEAAYSDERILALGMRELEFDRDWPASLRFVGPLTAAPPFGHPPPDFRAGRKTILVTLGTHLVWARDRAAKLIDEAAAAMPDCDFHFAAELGSLESVRDNVRHHRFIDYDRFLARYGAAIVHGGTGITYACIRAGTPMLVWPHDYDQFDHAARIVDRGLGLRLQPTRVVAGLRQLLTDPAIRSRVREFQALAARYDATRAVLEELRA